MANETKLFRKRFFGGFNRNDVVQYVSKLAKERNEYKNAVEAAQAEARVAAEEIEPLRLEVQVAKKALAEAHEQMKNSVESEKQISEEKEKAIQEAKDTASEVERLKQELANEKRLTKEEHSANENAQKELQRLSSDYETLCNEHEAIKREVEVCRKLKAEALESRIKIEKLEAAKKQFEELQPALDNLRCAFQDQ